MAKTKISQYDATAANNTDIDSINIAEGMAPSNVNNAIRELMAHLKDMDAGTQALTSPQLTSADINGGTIDGVTIGGASAGAGTFTTLTANTSITGTLATAAQPNITSVGSLTSLDVGGTVTATGLTVDGNANVDGALTFTNQGVVNAYVNSEEGFYFNIDSNNDQTTERVIQFGANAADSSGKKIALFQEGGDISFYEDTGTTPKLFWDASAESLGIGTSSPTNGKIEISNSTDGYESVRVNDSRATPSANKRTMDLRYTGTNGRTASNTQMLYLYDSNASSTQPFIQVDGSSSTHFVLDSSGNVGIGTSSPSSTLEVKGANNSDAILTVTGGTTAGLGSNAKIKLVPDGTAGLGVINVEGSDGSDVLAFQTNGSEAMRIDSSGSLLHGTTSSSIYNDTSGNGVNIKGQQGQIIVAKQSTSASDPAMILNNTGVDSSIMQFSKDGSSVGSIGSTASGGGGIRITNQGTEFSILLNGGTASTSSVTYVQSNLSPYDDNYSNLGSGSQRWKDLYLSGGVYLGGTGAANLLDDYEEGSGSFTSVTDASGNALAIQANVYYYTKVGRFVQLEIRVQLSSATAGEVRLNGPPFTMSSNDTELGVVIDRNVYAALSSQIRLRAGTNNSYMYGVVTYRTS